MIQPSHPLVPQVLSAPRRTLVPRLAVVLADLSRVQAHRHAVRPLAHAHRPSQAPAPLPAPHRVVRLLARPLAVSPRPVRVRVLHSRRVRVVRHVIRHFLQARRLVLSLRVRVVLAQAVAVRPVRRLSVVLAHPVIQDSLLLRPLAARPVAPHPHLRARVSRSYKASISILKAMNLAKPLVLWDLAPVSLIE